MSSPWIESWLPGQIKVRTEEPPKGKFINLQMTPLRFLPNSQLHKRRRNERVGRSLAGKNRLKAEIIRHRFQLLHATVEASILFVGFWLVLTQKYFSIDF